MSIWKQHIMILLQKYPSLSRIASEVNNCSKVVKRIPSKLVKTTINFSGCTTKSTRKHLQGACDSRSTKCLGIVSNIDTVEVMPQLSTMKKLVSLIHHYKVK